MLKKLTFIILSLLLTNCAVSAQRNSSRGAAVPPEIIGKWYASEMSNTTYSDRASGANNTASGYNASFEFKSDGSFVYAQFARTQVYGCETTVYNYNPGKFKIEGERITFAPTDDELIYKSNCSPSLNSDKHRAPVKSSFTFTFKTEDDIRYLCLTGADGKEGCWRKIEE